MRAEETPSPTVVVKGIPEAADEAEITNVFSAIAPISRLNVRLVRDRTTGASRGFAFIDFGR